MEHSTEIAALAPHPSHTANLRENKNVATYLPNH